MAAILKMYVYGNMQNHAMRLVCSKYLRGPLVYEVGYHPRKKNHVIKVVFQDQTMYARTSFRGAKTCKIGKKGVFLVILTNFEKDMTHKLRKTYAKKRI